jgi:acyl-CoA thioesterase-1
MRITFVAFLICATALMGQTNPRILLIGDSISMGYTPLVQEILKDKADVQRPKENCGETARGLAKMDAWLGEKKWDIIHFNFGLHDLKYLDAQGKYVGPDQGKQVASVPQYEESLRQIVARLKKTGAKLVWASTTPVPDGSAGRVLGDELKYNEAAAKVMKENGVAINDLHKVVVSGPEGMQLPKNVHFSKEGYAVLARAVVAACGF